MCYTTFSTMEDVEMAKMDYENLNEELTYNKGTGQFFWKKEAGTITGHGYRYIRVNGKMMLAHRMAWLMEYGEDPEGQLIDHINGNRLDNRIENLRLATFSQNGANAKRHSRNTSGLKGASKVLKKGKWTGKWQSTITVRNKQLYLGSFNTAEDAHAAYLVAAQQHHGEFASDGKPPD